MLCNAGCDVYLADTNDASRLSGLIMGINRHFFVTVLCFPQIRMQKSTMFLPE